MTTPATPGLAKLKCYRAHVFSETELHDIYLAADVEDWLERASLHAKKMSEQHLQEGVYTQARSWEGEWHGIERLLATLKGRTA